ncbi:MAG: DinB family protein, partial [Pirellulales bacterium]|nr:DinB family protein [Pirellulales bacterium]
VASHLAEIPQWTDVCINQDSFDVAPPGEEPYQMEVFSSMAEILSTFDSNVAAARKVIEATDDELFLKPWSLLNGGEVIMTMPRVAVVRSFILSHTIHHRAHLCVYLRVNDLPVPGLYGPSADDPLL